MKIIIKPLAINKTLCIFALGFKIESKNKATIRIKDKHNEQKNVSTIEKKKKK